MGGAQQSHNAYMLVYEKAKKKPLKIVCSDVHLDYIKAQPRSVISKLKKEAALSCDSTAIPRDKQADNNNNSDQSMMTQVSALSSAGKPETSYQAQMISTAASDAEMQSA